MTRDDAFEMIEAERARQHDLWAKPHAWGAGDCSSRDVADIAKIAVLTEECGEVARCVLDRSPADVLRAELVQVAAVAVAWIEAL